MKSFLACVAVFGVGAVVLTAQDPRGGGLGGGGMMARMAGPMLAQVADADKNGDVTAAEWQVLIASIETENGLDAGKLKSKIVAPMFDRDEDGLVTLKDLQAIFAARDGDGDGALSAEELGGGRGARGRRGEGGGNGERRPRGEGQGRPDTAELLKKYDANGNGQLDPEERAKAREELGGQGREGGEGRQGRQGQGRNNFMARGLEAGVLRQADKDQSGDVSAAEWTAFTGAMGADEKGAIAPAKITEIALKPAPEAAEGADEEGGRGGRRRGFDLVSMFDRMLDANGDEVFNKDDLEEIFDLIDENGDKTLQADELQPQRRGGDRRRGDSGRDV